MNCKQLNTIPIYQVLEYYGFQPKKSNSHKIWYLNPFRQENTPSFEVQIKTNTWSLYSENTHRRTVVDFLLRMEKKTLSDILQWSENQSFSKYTSSFKQNLCENTIKLNEEVSYKVTNITTVKYTVLLDYLKSRRLDKFAKELKQVFYEMNEKKYFAIGWKNDSNYWEVSYRVKDKENSHLFITKKRCLGNKDISTIKHKSKTLCVFEGYFDMLAYQITFKINNDIEDYIVLNSTSMVDRLKDKLSNYNKIKLYLDNDSAGNDATNFILSLGSNISDMRYLYQEYNDINDYLKSL